MQAYLATLPGSGPGLQVELEQHVRQPLGLGLRRAGVAVRLRGDLQRVQGQPLSLDAGSQRRPAGRVFVPALQGVCAVCGRGAAALVRVLRSHVLEANSLLPLGSG